MPKAIPKNAAEEVRVERTVYHGHDLLDVRVYTDTKTGDDRVPTKKGLTLSPATWRELLPEIQAALDGGGGADDSTAAQSR